MAGFLNPYSYFNPYQQNNYQAQAQQQAQPQTQPQQTNANGIIWVQGESGAKSYLVAPNTTLLLMDSESKKFYLKSADASGIPMPLRVFEYDEVAQNATESNSTPLSKKGGDYVTKTEFDEFRAKLSDLLKKKKVEKKAEEESDEQSVI